MRHPWDETEDTWEYMQADVQLNNNTAPPTRIRAAPIRYWLIDGRANPVSFVMTRIRHCSESKSYSMSVYQAYGRAGPDIHYLRFLMEAERPISTAMRRSCNRWLADRCGNRRTITLDLSSACAKYGQTSRSCVSPKSTVRGVLRETRGREMARGSYFFPLYEAERSICQSAFIPVRVRTSLRRGNLLWDSSCEPKRPISGLIDDCTTFRQIPKLRFGCINRRLVGFFLSIMTCTRRIKARGVSVWRGPGPETLTTFFKENRIMSPQVDEDLPIF
jgi:hypothetical protein